MSFSSENGIVLETNETQIWEWETKLVWAIEGEDNIIWINSVYFLEVLWVIDSTHISISFESALAPILITPLADPEKDKKRSKFTHIIMPLKI
jgi:DNA polymerase III sliding clamp (beta) subunit (PCNA family)